MPWLGSVGVETTGANRGRPFFSVVKANFQDAAGVFVAPETVRFMQFPAAPVVNSAFTDRFGTEDIPVANVIDDPTTVAL